MLAKILGLSSLPWKNRYSEQASQLPCISASFHHQLASEPRDVKMKIMLKLRTMTTPSLVTQNTLVVMLWSWLLQLLLLAQSSSPLCLQ